ncbi:MAG: hypothetical protein IJB46_07990 [Prevotella sp.]|nr:hypothetical protein [Prevotella sp.]
MKTTKVELRSLNQELPALYAEELEMRLETDPLAVGGLLDEIMPLSCTENYGSCQVNTGHCDENFAYCGKNSANCGVNI